MTSSFTRSPSVSFLFSGLSECFSCRKYRRSPAVYTRSSKLPASCLLEKSSKLSPLCKPRRPMTAAIFFSNWWPQSFALPDLCGWVSDVCCCCAVSIFFIRHTVTFSLPASVCTESTKLCDREEVFAIHKNSENTITYIFLSFFSEGAAFCWTGNPLVKTLFTTGFSDSSFCVCVCVHRVSEITFTFSLLFRAIVYDYKCGPTACTVLCY